MPKSVEITMPASPRMTGTLTPKAGRRVSGIDAARTVAAIGTVWVHSMRYEGTDYLGHFGRYSVPFFTFIAAWFLIARLRSRSDLVFKDHVLDRFNRLYVPFLYWTAVYLLLRHVKQWVAGGMGEPIVTWSVLVAGTQPHLWFLPFLCFWLIAMFPITKWAIRDRKREKWLGMLSFFFGVFLLLVGKHIAHTYGGMAAPGEVDSLQRTIANWPDRLPCFFFGYAFGMLIRRSPSSLQLSWLGAPAFASLWICSLTYMVIVDSPGGAYQNLAGLGLVGLALMPWPRSVTNVLGRWAPLSFGVYLNHMLFTELIRTIREQMGWERTFALDLVRFSVAVVGSFALAWLLRKWWLTRPMVP